ncbi:DUF185-domain-containing protein [Gigaspora margarita]|uniref:Protein arginine methyltransferase NDUFAF7 n=1 Tax=Gigaspora margarita TaxID=4874 RepID=A0A8H3X1A1_GIGMA|nr:DUF185-domain-containing protein [Gigaspora margarita]
MYLVYLVDKVILLRLLKLARYSLMGIWFLTQWQSQGKPDKIQVVELGPGRGTLLYDMLNAISSFSDCFRSICEVHLIEISSKLREIQYKKLCSSSKKFDGLNFFWHDSFNKISDKWSMIIAHEFFDALPIHLFECTSNGWREVLVDIDDTKHSLYNFRLIVASVPTKASIALTGSLAYRMFKIGDRIEISPDSMEISKQIANHIKSNGGASLIIDYGQDFIQGNTLRAIKHHEFVHPLSEPGQADLSADVNFCYLKESVTNLVEAYGPITQSKFLQSLGIKARLLMLLKSALYTNHKDLISSTERLVHPSAMGEIYKVLAFVPKGSLKVPIAFEKSNN